MISYTNYKDFIIDEIRATRFGLETLAVADFDLLDKWQRIGKDRDKPLYKLITGVQITEIKFVGIPTVFKFVWFPELVTDKGSIPDFLPDCIVDDSGTFWNLLGFCMHDGLYSNQNYPRLFADCVLKQIRDIGGESNGFKDTLVYRGVRIGGGFTWKKRTTDSLDMVREFGFRIEENDRFYLNEYHKNVRRVKR